MRGRSTARDGCQIAPRLGRPPTCSDTDGPPGHPSGTMQSAVVSQRAAFGRVASVQVRRPCGARGAPPAARAGSGSRLPARREGAVALPPPAAACTNDPARPAAAASLKPTHPRRPPGAMAAARQLAPMPSQTSAAHAALPSLAPAALQTRRSAVVAQATRPLWQPGVEAPKHLDGTMPGDFGFGERGTQPNAARSLAGVGVHAAWLGSQLPLPANSRARSLSGRAAAFAMVSAVRSATCCALVPSSVGQPMLVPWSRLLSTHAAPLASHSPTRLPYPVPSPCCRPPEPGCEQGGPELVPQR